jgi:DNA-binding winged helix-turn-helix (wHTH) protein
VEGDFQVGSWLIEPSLNAVSHNGESIHLAPKVMAVLVCLAEHAGQSVSKEDLLQTVWPDTFVGDDVLKGSISELRRVLEDDAREPTVIQTIPKRGYRLDKSTCSKRTRPDSDSRSRRPAPELITQREFLERLLKSAGLQFLEVRSPFRYGDQLATGRAGGRDVVVPTNRHAIHSVLARPRKEIPSFRLMPRRGVVHL